MKNLLFSFVFGLFIGPTYAQVSSSCAVPVSLAAEYDRDIKHIVVKLLFDLNSPDTALVRIPQSYIDPVAGGLAAIFNAISIPQRDSIFNMYCVHNNNGWPGIYEGFLVQVDTNYTWTQAWQNLTTLTGEPLMDTILTRYHLNIEDFYNWSFGNYALLSVDSSWNPYALIDSLKMTPGVLSAEKNSIIGAGGKISYGTLGTVRYYSFTYEFNDCFDGCDNYRQWSFQVNDDCTVYYLGSTDWGFFGVEPLPAPMNCNTFTSLPEIQNVNLSVLICPNPSTGKFSLQLKEMNYGSQYDVEIYTIQGTLIYKSVIDDAISAVDLGEQANGIYFINIFDGQTLVTEKIAIQF